MPIDRGRILVVDDEESARKPVSLQLRKAGYEVVEASDGEQAITALRRGDNRLIPDMILLDIRMPKFNGTEALECFRREFPSIPVVILTGLPDIELSLSVLKQGAVNYLVKPVAREKLLEAVHEAVQQYVSL
jgi:CheY-like chemotaxis protein